MVTVELEEVEGHFTSREKRAVKSLFEGAVLTFGDLVASELILKHTGPSMLVK